MSELPTSTPEKDASDKEKERQVELALKIIDATISWAVGKNEFALDLLLRGENKIDTEILYLALMRKPELYKNYIERNAQYFGKYISS